MKLVLLFLLLSSTASASGICPDLVSELKLSKDITSTCKEKSNITEVSIKKHVHRTSYDAVIDINKLYTVHSRLEGSRKPLMVYVTRYVAYVSPYKTLEVCFNRHRLVPDRYEDCIYDNSERKEIWN